MRLAVSVYLVIATACGPVVCCCAPGRAALVLQRLLPGEVIAHHRAPAPTCCGKGEATNPARGVKQGLPRADRSAETPGVPEKHCPCREQGGCAKHAPPSTEPRVEFSTEQLFSDAGPALWVLPTGFASEPPLPGHSDPRFPARSSVCPRAPHVLRC